MKSGAYGRKERGAGQAGDVAAATCLGLWLICAAGLVALALQTAGEQATRADMRLYASYDLPELFRLVTRAQALLMEPLNFSACVLGLAALLLLRGAKAESLVVLAMFALLGVTVAVRQMVQEVLPAFSDYAPYERILADEGFVAGQVVALAALGGLVFIFAERLLPDILDAWFLRLLTVALVLGIGPWEVYAEGQATRDVVAAYLLVALYLLPVMCVYGESTRGVAVEVLDEAPGVRTKRVYEVLFDAGAGRS